MLYPNLIQSQIWVIRRAAFDWNKFYLSNSINFGASDFTSTGKVYIQLARCFNMYIYTYIEPNYSSIVSFPWDLNIFVVLYLKNRVI